MSIVVPLYQKESTVRRAIESVRRQAFADFEVIVVDDGSTDQGPAIVQEMAYSDPRIRLVKRQNGGPGAAKNTGLRQAKAALITFLDADDEWEPWFLEQAFQALEYHPECDIYASAFRLGPSGIDRWEELRAHGIGEGVWRLRPGIGDRELSLCLGVIHSCSSLFRTHAVRRFGGFYEKDACRYGEDVYLWLQMILHCAVVRSFSVSAWYHTDASDLGLSSGRRDIPLEPVFTDPEPIRSRCPLELREALERWLIIHALRAVQMYAEFRDYGRFRYLVDNFLRVKQYRRQVSAAWLKLCAPRLFRSLRSLAPIVGRAKEAFRKPSVPWSR